MFPKEDVSPNDVTMESPTLIWTIHAHLHGTPLDNVDRLERHKYRGNSWEESPKI